MEAFDEIKPEFGEHGRENPFIVPEGYFDNFEERLNERMSGLSEFARNRGGRKILRPAYAYLTGFCILILAGIFISRLVLAPHATNLNSATNMTLLIQYSLENIDEQAIIEALPKTAMEPASSEITKEEVLNYIQEQNIDVNTIKDEL